MSLGTAHRDDGLQDAAGALGQGIDPDRIKMLPRIFKSDVPRRIKIEAVYHLTANLSYPLMVIMTALLIPAMIVPLLPGLVSDAADRLAPVHSIVGIDCRVLSGQPARTLSQDLDEDFFLSALSDGARHRPHGDQFQGGDGSLFGIKSAFVRTPKYRVAQKGEKSQAAKYRKRLKLAPWIELLIGCYFMLAIIYTFTNHNYFTAPFLILFVIGYWYTGLMSLLQGRFERWRQRKPANTDESSPKPFPVGV